MEPGIPRKRSELERWETLFSAAETACGLAYAPFSKLRVGAAAITGDGRIFPGANYESASYGLTMCAERSAVLAAQSAGAVPDLVAIALVADDPEARFLAPDAWVTPCGACRQWLFEASGRAGRDLEVFCGSAGFERIWATTARALLPGGFG